MSDPPAAIARGQVLVRVGLSLGALLLVGVAVVAVFAVAFRLAGAGAAPPPPLAAARDGQRPPDIVGTVSSFSRNILTIDTPQGPRPVLVHGRTVIRRPDGSPVSRDDLRHGVRVAVFGVPIDTQTFRADLVAVLPPPKAR